MLTLKRGKGEVLYLTECGVIVGRIIIAKIGTEEVKLDIDLMGHIRAERDDYVARPAAVGQRIEFRTRT